jgi:hypothetical protein
LSGSVAEPVICATAPRIRKARGAASSPFRNAQITIEFACVEHIVDRCREIGE